MLLIVLSMITALSALFCIFGKYANRTIQIYIFKPLTTILILLIAIVASLNLSGNYRYYIFFALLFSLFGDIFLMLPDKFLPGLISFSFAHVLFLAAFFTLGNSSNWWLILIFALSGILIYKYLFPSLGKMRMPVLFYITIILSMAWRSWENYLLIGNTATFLIALGTLMFIISDTNIAVKKFRKQYKSTEAIILSTYFIAIWLISFSLSLM